jgi:hypothetical protein
MASGVRDRAGEYVLQERKFAGTNSEMLQQVDELIASLFGFRRLLVDREIQTEPQVAVHPRAVPKRQQTGRARFGERGGRSRDACDIRRPGRRARHSRPPRQASWTTR